jgi:hypothetical protein
VTGILRVGLRDLAWRKGWFPTFTAYTGARFRTRMATAPNAAGWRHPSQNMQPLVAMNRQTCYRRLQ